MFKVLGFCLLFLLIWLSLAIFQSYVLISLWGWFVVPTGLHALSIKSAIGISLIINLLTAHFGNMSSEKDMLEYGSYWMMSQLLILLAGYFIKIVFPIFGQ